METLKTKTALITGGSKGLGFEIAKSFVEEGANVVICGRNNDDLTDALKKLRKLGNPEYVGTATCDVSIEKEVKSMVSAVIKRFKKIDILVNNAGIHGSKGSFDKVDFDDWLTAINTNLIGSALVIHEVLPYMVKEKYGKIIQISGGGATTPFPSLSGYATSKAGVVRLVETIAKEMYEYNIDANCVAPGLLNTRLVDDILANKDKVNPEYYQRILEYKTEDKFMPIKKAVDLCLFLASEESNKITGKLISAQWDNWNLLKECKEEIILSDIFTIRRIVGKDRGLNHLDVYI